MPRVERSSRRKVGNSPQTPDGAARETPAESRVKSLFSFGRPQRLLDKAAYDRVFANARRSRDRFFTILYRSNQKKTARLGLAIAKKNCRKAVARNRLKRIIRESFREHRAALAGIDFVVLNNRDAEHTGNRELFASLAAHWQACRQAALAPQEKD